MSNVYIDRWVLMAKNDLKVARNELKLPKRDMVTEAICFHCQQAAEKILKAYLISRGIAFAKTHNLEFLLEMCKKEDADFKNVDVSNLTYYAVEVRYPDDFYIPDQKEAEESYNVAADIMKFVLKKMKPKK